MKDNQLEQTIRLPNDYEGKVIAVLIKSKCEYASKKATLYIHGFNDYFFQEELVDRFNKEGYNFYALDLRKYGRSYLPHQTFNDTRSLDSYFREILEAIKIIKAEGSNTILLGGHSTGGLIVSLFAQDYGHLVQGIWMNSPFFQFNKNYFTRKILIPIVARIGKNNPHKSVPGGFSKQYGISLHRSEKGEWDYDLKLKPHIPPIVTAGWIRAIHKGHQRFNKGIYIGTPILIMHSSRSAKVARRWNEKALRTDIILDIKSIAKKAKLIDGSVELISIKNGIHDLFLSPKEVREHAFNELFSWINKHF